MRRYIPFLCLLFINLVFCYDYLDVNPHYRPVHKIMKSSESDNVDEWNGNQNVEANDNDETAEMDVASFIQSPDYDRRGSNYQFEDQYKREQPSNKNGFDSLVDASLEEYDDKSQDYKNVDSDTLEENINSAKQSQQRHALSNNIRNNKEIKKYYNDINNRHLEKKCVFKNMKIPFFSHDKTTRLGTLDTTLKKNKKRRLFNFNSKKHKTGQPQLSTTSLSSSTTKSFIKLKKRSYFERICPICKRKFIARRSQARVKEPHNNIIHNSRQFYQNKESLNDSNYNIKKDTEPENLMKRNKIFDKAYSEFGIG